MKDVTGQVAGWIARGDRVVPAVIVSIRRSAPRPTGSGTGILGRIAGEDDRHAGRLSPRGAASGRTRKWTSHE